jgi:hypothetical protein
VELLRSNELLGSMGAAARHRVIHEFSGESWTRRTQELYREVVEEPRGGRRPRRVNNARLSVQLLHIPRPQPRESSARARAAPGVGRR